MILRKPYKFFIKHFRLFHLILASLFIYSLARISNVISFINKFTSSDVTLKTITMDEFNSLYSIFDFIIPVIALLLSIVLLVVMTMKQKANKFYGYSVCLCIILLAMNAYGRSTMLELTSKWLTKGVLETLVDVYVFVILACIVEVGVALSRAIGFNISRFDFNSDISQFELDEKDNEEFEVAVDFDVNDVKRGIQKRSRYVKYFLKENKSTLIWSFVTIIGFIGIFWLYSFSKNKIKADDISNLSYVGDTPFKVNDIYIVDKDVDGNSIPNDLNLLVFDVTIENPTKSEYTFNPGTLSVTIGEDVYGRKTEYANYVSDLGTVFYNEKIKKEATIQRLFIFAIPKKNIKNKMYLGVSENGDTKYYKFDVHTIETLNKEKTAKLEEEMNFEGSTMGNTKIKINSFDIKEVAEVKYKLNNRVYIETLMPTFTGNNDNYILRLDGEFDFDKSAGIKSVFGFINKYGYIEYEIDGKQYIQNTGFIEVKSKKVNMDGTYFIEVNSEIAKASKIILGFNLRYANYKYYLKGSA